jgi:hypothetical protein
VFPAASYQYVLYGMGFKIDAAYLDHSRLPADSSLAIEQINLNAMAIKNALSKLPTNRELIQKIHAYGFAKI